MENENSLTLNRARIFAAMAMDAGTLLDSVIGLEVALLILLGRVRRQRGGRVQRQRGGPVEEINQGFQLIRSRVYRAAGRTVSVE